MTFVHSQILQPPRVLLAITRLLSSTTDQKLWKTYLEHFWYSNGNYKRAAIERFSWVRDERSAPANLASPSIANQIATLRRSNPTSSWSWSSPERTCTRTTGSPGSWPLSSAGWSTRSDHSDCSRLRCRRTIECETECCPMVRRLSGDYCSTRSPNRSSWMAFGCSTIRRSRSRTEACRTRPSASDLSRGWSDRDCPTCRTNRPSLMLCHWWSKFSCSFRTHRRTVARTSWPDSGDERRPRLLCFELWRARRSRLNANWCTLAIHR